MTGFPGEALAREIGPFTPLAGPVLIAGEVDAERVALWIEFEQLEWNGNFGSPSLRGTLRRGLPVTPPLPVLRASASSVVGLRAASRNRES